MTFLTEYKSDFAGFHSGRYQWIYLDKQVDDVAEMANLLGMSWEVDLSSATLYVKITRKLMFTQFTEIQVCFPGHLTNVST